MKNIQIFSCDGMFTIIEEVAQDEYAVYEKQPRTAVINHLKLPKRELTGIMNDAKVIGGVIYRVDYIQKEPTKLNLTRGDDNKKYLTITTNPSHHWDMSEIDLNQELLDEYFNVIHDGKLGDVIKIITSTLKSPKTQKKNNLIYVAPSDTGKTEAIELMSFKTMTGKQFNDAIKATTGLSQEEAKQLEQSGLLLVDDFPYIPAIEMKTSTDTTSFRIMNQGTKRLPTKMKVLTTTDVSKADKLTKELWNRFYIVIANDNGMTVPDSEFFQDDPEKYLKQTTYAIRKMIIEALEKPMDYDELSKLKETYDPEQQSEMPEMFEAIINDAVNELDVMNSILFTNGKVGVIGRGFKKKVIKPLLDTYLDEDFLADKSKHVSDIFDTIFEGKSSGYKTEKDQVEGKKEKGVFYLRDEHQKTVMKNREIL